MPYLAGTCSVSVSPEEYSTSGFDWEMTSCIWRNVWFGSANSFCVSHGGLLRAICTRCSHLERGHYFSPWSLAVTCSVYLAPEENELEFSGDDFWTIFNFLRLARCDSGYMFVRLNMEAFQMVSHISYVQVDSVS